MDGPYALPDEDLAQCRYGDEPACAGLQSETLNGDLGCEAVDGSDSGLTALYDTEIEGSTSSCCAYAPNAFFLNGRSAKCFNKRPRAPSLIFSTIWRKIRVFTQSGPFADFWIAVCVGKNSDATQRPANSDVTQPPASAEIKICVN